jgi:ankyrin repeat protein
MDAALEPTLHMAVTNGRVQDVLQLIEAGANMDERNLGGGHVLHVAVFYGHAEVVQILLEHGADASVKGDLGYTPLHIACRGKRMAGRMAIIGHLLLHGADVSVKTYENGADDDDDDDDGDAGGRTPLHTAILYSSIQVVRLLLAHGADISIKQGEGFNSLHWAVQIHAVAVIREHDRLHHKPLLPVNSCEIEKAVKVIQMLLAHRTDNHAKIAHLSAITDGGKYGHPSTPEQLAYTNDIKEMLRAALLHAEEARRGLLQAFTLGQHKRLGAASHIRALDPEMVQMIMDRV